MNKFRYCRHRRHHFLFATAAGSSQKGILILKNLQHFPNQEGDSFPSNSFMEGYSSLCLCGKNAFRVAAWHKWQAVALAEQAAAFALIQRR